MKLLQQMLLSIILIPSMLLAQKTYVNEKWSSSNGTPSPIDWSASTFDGNNELIIVGNTMNTSGNSDILVSKYNRTGTLLWEKTFAGSANDMDYGAAVTVDGSNNIYVAGTAKNTGSDEDMYLLKYSSSGTLLWSSHWDGPSSNWDVATSIGIDGTGAIYIAGASYSPSKLSDYALVKFTPNGNLIWSYTFDYSEHEDAAVDIRFDGSNNVILTGASEATAGTWDYSTVKVTPNGQFIQENRVVIPGAGIDNVLAIEVFNNNIYITGFADDNGTQVIQTVKIDDTFQVDWINTYSQGVSNRGNSIAVDASGNSYVAGSSKLATGEYEMVVIKYNSGGTKLWERTYHSTLDPLGDATASKVIIDPTGGILVTGKVKRSSDNDILTIKYSESGENVWEKKYDGGNGDDEGLCIQADSDGNVFVTGTVENTGGTNSYTSIRYEQVEKTFQYAYLSDGVTPKHVEGEIVVRFTGSSMISDAVSSTKLQTGTLDEFVIPSVIAEMDQATGLSWSNQRAYKVYEHITNAQSTMINKFGDIIEIPDFWATLIVEIPDGPQAMSSSTATTVEDEISISYTLGNSASNVIYSNANAVAYNFDVDLMSSATTPTYSTPASSTYPNDEVYNAIYGYQSGLYDDEAGANLPEAWEIDKGNDEVVYTIFSNDLVHWEHEELGYSKVYGFFDQISGSIQYPDDPPITSQSTRILGLIAARSHNGTNNDIGIAGIAGGDGSANTQGIGSYSVKPVGQSAFNADAILNFCINSGQDSYFEIDIIHSQSVYIQGNSYNLHPNELLGSYREAIKFSKSVGITMIVGIPDEASWNGIIGLANPVLLPHEYPDDYCLVVGTGGDDGACGTSNNNGWGPYYIHEDNHVDVIAPGYVGALSTLISPLSEEASGPNGVGVTNYYQAASTNAASGVSGGIASLMIGHHVAEPGTIYNNELSTEDIEYLLEKSAVEISGSQNPQGTSYNVATPYPVGWDKWNGHGRVDAGQALKYVDRSVHGYRVDHHTYGSSASYSNDGSGLTIEIKDPISTEQPNGSTPTVAQGTYNGVSRYKASWTISLPPLVGTSEEVVDAWPREFFSSGLETASELYDETDISVTLQNMGTSSATAVFETYCYQLADQTWVPAHPFDLTLDYSLHVLDYEILSLEDNINIDNITITPNPSSSVINIEYQVNGAKEVEYEILDVSGKTMEQGNLSGNDNLLKTSIDVSKYSNGVYFIQFLVDDNVVTKKFIKN